MSAFKCWEPFQTLLPYKVPATPWVLYTRKHFVRDLKVRKQNLLKEAKEGVLKIIKEEEEHSISTDETREIPEDKTSNRVI